MPRLRPRVSTSATEATVSTSETIRPVRRWAMKLILGTRAKNFMVVLASPDRHVGQLAARERQLGERARADDGRELRADDADGERDREALDRARAEREQHHRADQHRDVGVGNGQEGAVVTGLDRRMRRVAVAQLLADALVD